MIKKCLSIAGFDGSGGAGIQADLKTFSALGCYGMTVLTALPVQNTCGVRHCYDIPIDCINEQLHAIFDDIKPDSIKIGMLFSEAIIINVSHFLKQYAQDIPIILDPVMVAKSGDSLLDPNAINALLTHLIPHVTLITPNLPECQQLVGDYPTKNEIAKHLLATGVKAVLIKGGHDLSDTSDDLYLDQQGQQKWLTAKRLQTKNTHGTGCTLSAAICAYVAKGHSLLSASELAKQYLYDAILASQNQQIGKGHGPVHHFHQWWN